VCESPPILHKLCRQLIIRPLYTLTLGGKHYCNTAAAHSTDVGLSIGLLQHPWKSVEPQRLHAVHTDLSAHRAYISLHIGTTLHYRCHSWNIQLHRFYQHAEPCEACMLLPPLPKQTCPQLDPRAYNLQHKAKFTQISPHDVFVSDDAIPVRL
jgi:hypothetical protein